MTRQWHGWEDLGGPITSSPAVASWGPARLDVFAAGADGQLVHKWWDGQKWHDWQTLGGTFKGGPATVSWGPDRIDVFVRGQDDHLGHLWWDGKKPWHGWEDLGGPITSSPAVTSWAGTPRRLDVFAAGADGQLVHKWHEEQTWHDWQTLGGTFKGAPAAVSWGMHRIDVFVQGTDDHLGHLWWHEKKWHGWEDLSVSVSPESPTTELVRGWISQPPAVASWAWGRLDVFFAADVPHAKAGLFPPELVHMWWDDSSEWDEFATHAGLAPRQWSRFDPLGGKFYDNPAAVSKAGHQIDVFVRGKDDHLGHLFWR